MKRVIYILSTMALVATLATACYDGKINPKGEDEPTEQTLVAIDGSDAAHGYGIPMYVTNPNTDPTAPADKTTYTVVSYQPNYWDDYVYDGISHRNGYYYYVNDTQAGGRLSDEKDYVYGYHLDPPGFPFRNLPPWNEDLFMRGFGQYAYIADPAYMGVLQPCDINVDYSFNKRNPQNGQSLNTTYTSTANYYKTVFIHPALPLVDIPEPNARLRGQKRIMLHRREETLVSDPFLMGVRTGMIFLPDTAAATGNDKRYIGIHDARSKVMVDVKKDPDMGSTNFIIDDVKLINAGCWGWYQPLMQYTDISHREPDPDWVYIGSKWVSHPYVTGAQYSSHTSDHSEEDLVIAYDPSFMTSYDGDVVKGPADIYRTSNSGLGEVWYTTGTKYYDGIYLFPNNYTRSNVYLTPMLRFNLGLGSDIFVINIPLSIEMKSGYRYKFNITVTSVSVRVAFQVIPWWNVSYGDSNFGQPINEYLLGTWTVNGWENAYTETGNIG